MILVQTIIAILITVLILLQQPASSAGSLWGGAGDSYHTKRGAEKILFWVTIIFTFMFTTLSIINVLLS